MTTFKYSGEMRWNDDSQLWTEILGKERNTNKIHKNYSATEDFANTHASRFGEGKLHRLTGGKREDLVKKIGENDLKTT